jgi:hypothetical protein
MPGIFICYRRDDTGGYARHFYDRLIREFGSDQIFMDIDDIPVGEHFVEIIDRRIRACDVMVVLIGRNWLTPMHTGRRRIDDSADFVRLEIEAALAKNITVIPVLVGGAQMPTPQDLPGRITRLAYLNAFELYDRMFEASVAGLISTLRPLVKTPRWQHWLNIGPALRKALHRLRSGGFPLQHKRPIALAFAASALLLFLISFVAPRLGERSSLTQSPRR